MSEDLPPGWTRGPAHAWFTCGACGGVAFTIDDAPAFDSGRTCTCEVPTREPVRGTVTVRSVTKAPDPIAPLMPQAPTSARNQRRLARRKR